MLKKYLPFLFLLAALALFFWVKQHQRGGKHSNSSSNIEVQGSQPFDRTIEHITFSKHARCRMDCRHIDESEVKEILKEGVINYDKIEESPKGKSYPLEGDTHDGQHVRIVFAPHENELVVVTVIDLGREWPCECN